MSKPIYLDYNATTPVDPRVLEVMIPFLKDNFGNPASMNHSYGWAANQALDKAREQVASLIGCRPKEVVWTSGATESNNLALQSLAQSYVKRKEPIHIITSQIEHKSVLDVCRSLEESGVEVTYLRPSPAGEISAEEVRNAIKPNTRLISLFLGQNEIGTINPIKEIGAIAAKNNILFHVDGAQAVGKTPINVAEMNIDLLSASGHKLYAPKGIGFLYIRENIKLQSLFHGGKQEKSIRPGTQNVAGAIAMGKACELCQHSMNEENERLLKLQKKCIQTVLKSSKDVVLNGHPTQRLTSNISFSFSGVAPESFDLYLGDLAISSGSACSTGEPSYVLKALGHSDSWARATIRLGIGRFTSEQDIDFACDKITQMLAKKSSQNLRVML